MTMQSLEGRHRERLVSCPVLVFLLEIIHLLYQCPGLSVEIVITENGHEHLLEHGSLRERIWYRISSHIGHTRI